MKILLVAPPIMDFRGGQLRPIASLSRVRGNSHARGCCQGMPSLRHVHPLKLARNPK